MKRTAIIQATNSVAPVYGPGYTPAMAADHRAMTAELNAEFAAEGKVDPSTLPASHSHLMTEDRCDTLCGIDLVVISDEFPDGVCIATDMAYLTCPTCKAKA